MVFPVVLYGCKSWTIKKAEHRRTDAFELWCWGRLLRVPWTARRSNLSIPTPGACSNSCPLSRWCHPTSSSSVIHFSCLQSFPASGSFQMSQLSTSGGQSIGVSASDLPVNMQDWFPLGWTGWISLPSKGFSRVFSNTTVQKHQFFDTQLSLWSNSHISTDYWKRCPTSVVAWWLHSFFFMTFYM